MVGGDIMADRIASLCRENSVECPRGEVEQAKLRDKWERAIQDRKDKENHRLIRRFPSINSKTSSSVPAVTVLYSATVVFANDKK